MNEFYLKKIRITNVRCIKDAVINLGPLEPGSGELIEIIGENETGKSSIHDGCIRTWNGGSDPNLIRDGSDRAEGTLLFSDGTLIARTQTKTKSELVIVGPDGATVDAPATFIKKLGAWFTRDPLKFDNADPKEREKILLDIAPIVFEPAEIAESLRQAVAKVIPAPEDTVSLKEFGKFYKSITDRRALISGQRDEKAGFVETLRQTLQDPEGDEVQIDWAARLKAVEANLAEIDATEKREIREVNTVASARRIELTKRAREHDDLAQKLFQGVLARARTGEDLRVESAADIGQEPEWALAMSLALIDLGHTHVALKLLSEGEAEAVDAAKARASAAREALASTKAEAQLGRDSQIKESGTRENMARTQADADRLSKLWDDFQAAAHALEKLRSSKVDAALLPGMEIASDGAILIKNDDGVLIPWNDQNGATRFINSIALCTRGIDRDVWNGFIAMDGGERLGPRRKEQLREAVRQWGGQALLFTVASPEWIAEHGPDLVSIPAEALKVRK